MISDKTKGKSGLKVIDGLPAKRRVLNKSVNFHNKSWTLKNTPRIINNNDSADGDVLYANNSKSSNL